MAKVDTLLHFPTNPDDPRVALCGRSLDVGVKFVTSRIDDATCPFCKEVARVQGGAAERDKAARHAEAYGAATPSPKKGITAAERQMMVHWITGMEFERLLDGKEVRAVPRTMFSDNRLGSYVEVVGEGTFFTGLYRLSTGKWVVCHERVS